MAFSCATTFYSVEPSGSAEHHFGKCWHSVCEVQQLGNVVCNIALLELQNLSISTVNFNE
jgi:hypothetical protein